MANKRRSPLAKLQTTTDDNCYETTIDDCKFWFRILNQEIFNNKLEPLEIDVRWRRKAHAWYQYPSNGKTDDVPLMLLMNKKYKSKKFMVSVLFHEMVHHHQFLYNEPVGHGPSFTRWKEKAKMKGLDLRVVYP